MFLKSYLKISLIVLLLAMPAFASSDGGEAGIFSGDIFTALFTLFLFIALVAVLGKFAWGPILESLKTRELHISSAIESAEKNQEKAEQKLATYEKRLARAQQEADELIEQARLQATDMVNQMKQEYQMENQKIRQEAKKDIERAQQNALKEMHIMVTELATDLAGRIIAKNISTTDHQELLEESLQALAIRQNNG